METLRINELHEKLVEDIINSGLNIGTVFYIVSSIKKELEEYYLDQVQKEKEENIAKEKSDSNGD